VLAVLVPPLVVTSTLALPAVFAPVVQVIEVALTTLTPVHVTAPMVTVAPLTKFVPVMVTAVAPAVEPDDGEIALTVGADAGCVANAGAAVNTNAAITMANAVVNFAILGTIELRVPAKGEVSPSNIEQCLFRLIPSESISRNNRFAKYQRVQPKISDFLNRTNKRMKRINCLTPKKDCLQKVSIWSMPKDRG
jgi:hypothetical protein